jgi:hypothetical protein
VGRLHRSPTIIRIADEPDGPPELRALSFRALPDEGDDIGAVLRTDEPGSAGRVDARSYSAAPPARGQDDGEDPAALAFVAARPPDRVERATAPPPRRPAAAVTALIGVLVVAAFLAGRTSTAAVAPPAPASPSTPSARPPDHGQHERARRRHRHRAQPSRTGAPRQSHRRRTTRAGKHRSAARATVTASAAAAPVSHPGRPFPTRASAPPDEFGFEGQR